VYGPTIDSSCPVMMTRVFKTGNRVQVKTRPSEAPPASEWPLVLSQRYHIMQGVKNQCGLTVRRKAKSHSLFRTFASLLHQFIRCSYSPSSRLLSFSHVSIPMPMYQSKSDRKGSLESKAVVNDPFTLQVPTLLSNNPFLP